MIASPDRAIRRIERAMFALAVAGAIACFAWGGWAWLAGWLLGSAASVLNFRLLRRAVFALGSDSAKPRVAVGFAVRYLLLGVGGYVILKYTAISLLAALAGLFVSAAAVIVEILIELVYARN
jgi:hypothetical protein